jgi:hypothetical protein
VTSKLFPSLIEDKSPYLLGYPKYKYSELATNVTDLVSLVWTNLVKPALSKVVPVADDKSVAVAP